MDQETTPSQSKPPDLQSGASSDPWVPSQSDSFADILSDASEKRSHGFKWILSAGAVLVLGFVGGVGAIATVHILTQTATTTLFTDTPYTFKIENAVLSMAAAFAVGVGASFLPALRVTQIDVVQALRGE